MKLDRIFKIQESGSTLSREIIGGLTIYMTSAYILFVQPAVLSSLGMDFGAVMLATAFATAFASILMGLLANYPILVAPAMGHNFFFAYTVCIGMGLSWQIALGANFVSGLIFVVICLFPFASHFIDMVPASLKNAIAVGIGLLIALVGLQWSGLVVGKEGTIIGLGELNQPQVILSLLGLLFTSILLSFQIRGALLIGIIFTAILGIPFGLVTYQGLFSLPPAISPTFLKIQPWLALKENLLMVIFVFFFLDLFDTVGTLIGVSQQAGFIKEGKLPRSRRALFSDAAGTVFGTMLGTSTLTSYIESSAGIVAGARTGLAAVIAGICFLFSIFLYPLIKMIGEGIELEGIIYHPITAPALILIGSFMLRNVKFIEWDDPTEAIPAFLTLLIMPLTFSITEGISFGFISYLAIKTLTGKAKELNPLIWVFGILFLARYIYLYL